MSVASTKVTNKEMLVIEEIDGIHGHRVDFETTSFALLPKQILESYQRLAKQAVTSQHGDNAQFVAPDIQVCWC